VSSEGGVDNELDMVVRARDREKRCLGRNRSYLVRNEVGRVSRLMITLQSPLVPDTRTELKTGNYAVVLTLGRARAFYPGMHQLGRSMDVNLDGYSAGRPRNVKGTDIHTLGLVFRSAHS
jgi:hypothetical protein